MTKAALGVGKEEKEVIRSGECNIAVFTISLILLLHFEYFIFVSGLFTSPAPSHNSQNMIEVEFEHDMGERGPLR